MEPGWKWLKGKLYEHGQMTTKEALEAAGRAGHSTNRNTLAQYVIDLNRYGPNECDHRGSTTELLYKLAPGQTLPNLPSTEIKGRLLAALSTDPASWQVLMAGANISSSGLLQVTMSELRHDYGIGIDGRRYITLVTREPTGQPPMPQPRPPQQVTLLKLKFLEPDCCEADFQPPSTFSRST